MGQRGHQRAANHFPLTLLLVLWTLGCGKTSAPLVPGKTATCPLTPGTNVQVPLLIASDSALGPLLALELQVDQVTLSDVCGNSVSLLSAPLTVEWTHVNGVSEPLLLATIPQGTYTSAAVTYENPDVAYLWPGPLDFVANIVTTAALTGRVTLPSPISVGSAPTSILLDTLLTQPFQTTGKTDTVSPAFRVTQVPVATQPTNDSNGKLGLRGLLSSIDPASGRMTVVNQAAVALPAALGPTTQYQGISGAGMLKSGMPVDLDIAIQGDGSLLATRVQVENPAATGAWAGPLVVLAPQSGYDEVLPRQMEDARDLAQLYSNYPAYFFSSGASAYALYGGSIDLADLPFTPRFASAADLALAQGTSVSYAAPRQVTPAASITLIPRTVSGTVTAISSAGNYTAYTVALAANDLLTMMTGTTALMAYTNAGTQVESASSLAVGSAVNFSGLLFQDNGTLRLVSNQARLQIPAN